MRAICGKERLRDLQGFLCPGQRLPLPKGVLAGVYFAYVSDKAGFSVDKNRHVVESGNRSLTESSMWSNYLTRKRGTEVRNLACVCGLNEPDT